MYNKLQYGYLDVHDNSAGTARLAAIKYPGTTPKKGTFFLNPGDSYHLSCCPRLISNLCKWTGSPGFNAILSYGQTFSQPLRGTYDLVSWDPRGVGRMLYVHVAIPMQ